MTTPIEIPRLGMATAEASLIEWTAKEGEWVEESQVVVVIEVDKIRSDVEAPAAGFLHILSAEGSTAPVGQAVGLIAESKEELEALQKEPPQKKPARAAGPAEAARTTGREERIRISPVARKMAEEHAVDITGIEGSGPGGRITREDIEKAIAGKETPSAEAYEGRKVQKTIPLAGMRKSIAEHMQRSLSVSAQLTNMGEIDMGEIVQKRKDLLEKESAPGVRITYTDILVFALARLLGEHPVINSSLIENEIITWDSINIGVAVALEEGLIVPVVKDADDKSLAGISQAVKTLTEKARTGKLTHEEVSGGTFTLTNLGALGGGWNFETAIINQPESAILRTGSITERAAVRNGQIVVRPIMTYSFTYDHRVIDGAVAAKFMASLIGLLEDPGQLLE